MRVHLLSTPNVQVTAAYYMDVFSGFTRRFAELLHEQGATVYLYGSEETDVPCTELVTCISKADQESMLGEVPYWRANYDVSNPLWQHFNLRATAGIQARKEAGDWIATIAGTANFPVYQQHSDLRTLEYSIGYRGVCAPYRVYQSQAWRACVHGFTGQEFARRTDDVIYHWFHEDEFPTHRPNGYLLYVGRLVSVKGLKSVCQAAERAGKPLYLIGEGDPSLITYGDYLGHQPPSERNRWMAAADALLAPTEYLEPSACVATEAQLCGTPVIASNWGGFPEYVEDRQTGYLCTTVDEMVDAIGVLDAIDRDYVRARARQKYGWATGRAAYDRYFARLGAVQPSPVPQGAAVQE